MFQLIVVVDPSLSVNMEATSTIRRSLLGYRLEVNFEECYLLSQSATSFVYKKPKPGQGYTFMLSSVTCAMKNIKQHRTWVRIISFYPIRVLPIIRG